MKELKVTMTVVLNDQSTEEEMKNAINEIKKWEHHIDYCIDINSYKEEINCIKNVKVTEVK